ncbi:conserved hypothetical protein [Nitrospira defluvii]|uniref:Uncharacterized protein n=1 Tax=Nitrospira defluvii TaxID=330214 RepID=A0ABN7LXN1_9BACT|nr:conserved hypothetical protein [Nitrospira defluvii]
MIEIEQHIRKGNILLPGRVACGHLHRSQGNGRRLRWGRNFLDRCGGHLFLDTRFGRRHRLSSAGSRFARAAVKEEEGGDGTESEQGKRAQTFHGNLRRRSEFVD